MSEDVKKSVEELEVLYYKGSKTVDALIAVYEELVEDRFDRILLPSLPHPYVNEDNAQKALDRYDTFKGLSKSVDDFYAEWTGAVNAILKDTPRFRLLFNDPNEAGYMGNIWKNIPQPVQAIEDKLSDLYRRVQSLYKIIIEMDRNADQMKRPNTKDIEPATYDKKTRTIFFADEAIRFKKDATYSPAICELMFSHPEKKIWRLTDLLKLWDEVAYYGELNAPNDWHKVYEAIKRINDRIKEKTGIDDLFLFSTTSVRLNSSYLEVTKKSQ